MYFHDNTNMEISGANLVVQMLGNQIVRGCYLQRCSVQRVPQLQLQGDKNRLLVSGQNINLGK